MLRISIIIPIYNREKLLLDTLTSIVAQTYRPLELILVDNNSTDESLRICNEFKIGNQSDLFDIIVTSEEKKGANAARNKGLKLATSEYISFYDSDDSMLPYKMERIANAIKKNKSPDIIGSTVYFKFTTGNKKLRTKTFSNKIEDHILTGFLSTQTMTIKTNLLREIGGWNESVFRWQDWELGIRLLLKTNNIVWVKNPPLDEIYVHEKSITGKGFSHSFQEISKAINEALHAIDCSDIIEKEKLKNCVYLKKMIIAGEIFREGKKDISEYWFSEIMHEIPKDKRWLFKCLFKYKKMGGRGAWKIYKLFT